MISERITSVRVRAVTSARLNALRRRMRYRNVDLLLEYLISLGVEAWDARLDVPLTDAEAVTHVPPGGVS